MGYEQSGLLEDGSDKAFDSSTFTPGKKTSIFIGDPAAIERMRALRDERMAREHSGLQMSMGGASLEGIVKIERIDEG